MKPAAHHRRAMPLGRRISSQKWGDRTRGYATAVFGDMISCAISQTSFDVTDPPYHTDPSPSRFAFSQGEPKRGIGKKMSVIAYHVIVHIALLVKEANPWPSDTILKGSKKCKNHLFFWLRSQLLALRAVSTTTQSALSQVQVQVLSRLKFWAQTRLAQPLLAQPQACSAMTQGSATNTNSRAIPVRQKSMNRRWGSPLAAIFCLGGES